MILLAKRKQKIPRDPVNLTPPPSQLYPAVSVIIPLYNAEKYIGECLDSILNQTFQNFEVIVVDDCSTDGSLKIAESYLEKFGERMTLIHFEKNSGGAAVPRNKGLILSCGEYIYYVDADDMLTKTALEEAYGLAKKYDADVVYFTRYYDLSQDGSTKKIKNIPVYKRSGKKIVLDDNLTERIDDMMNAKYKLGPHRSFCQRKLLVENELFFPNTKPYEDVIRGYAVFVYAKRFLRVPNLIYFYRNNDASMTRSKRTPEQEINFWLNPLILGIKALDELIGRHEYFKKNPQAHHAFLKSFVRKRFKSIFDSSLKLQPHVVYEALKQGFGSQLGEYDVLIPALCSYVNSLQRYYQKKINDLTKSPAKTKRRIAQPKAEVKRLQNKE